MVQNRTIPNMFLHMHALTVCLLDLYYLHSIGQGKYLQRSKGWRRAWSCYLTCSRNLLSVWNPLSTHYFRTSLFYFILDKRTTSNILGVFWNKQWKFLCINLNDHSSFLYFWKHGYNKSMPSEFGIYNEPTTQNFKIQSILESKEETLMWWGVAK